MINFRTSRRKKIEQTSYIRETGQNFPQKHQSISTYTRTSGNPVQSKYDKMTPRHFEVIPENQN